MAFTDVKRVIRNAPYRHTWIFRDANGNLMTSVASIAAQVAKDTCNPTAAANAPAAQTGNQLYYLDLTAAEMAADIIEVLVTGSSARAEYSVIKSEPALDSGVAQAGTSNSITLASTAQAVADIYNGSQIEIVRYTGAGQMRTITDYAASLVASVDRPWIATPDATSVYIIHPRTGTPQSEAIRTFADIREIVGNSTAAQMLQDLYKGAFIAGTVDDATPTTTSFTGSAVFSTTADFYNDMFVLFTSGTLKGIPRKITDYAATRDFTTSAFPAAPANGDSFLVIAKVE